MIGIQNHANAADFHSPIGQKRAIKQPTNGAGILGQINYLIGASVGCSKNQMI
jgi:hypothetical protein